MAKRAEPYRYQRSGIVAAHPTAFLDCFFGPITRPNEQRGNVELVHVHGPLTVSPDICCDSYEQIRARVQAALSGTARAVVMVFDSPGGDLAGCLDLSAAIRTDADAAQKPLVSYVVGKACSAAYAIACAADSIVLGASALVGSIGVIDTRLDVSRQMAAMGVSMTFIASGEQKAYGHPELPLTDQELRVSKQLITELSQPFKALVAARRSLSVDSVASYEAAVLTGQTAITAGLADSVMGLDAVVASLTVGEMPPMGMAKIIQALREAAEAGDEQAKRMLSAMDSAPEPEPEQPSEPESADPDEPPTEPDEDDQPAAAASVSASTAADLVAQVAALSAQVASMRTQNEAQARDQLLASRGDLPEPLRKLLASKPVAEVRAIVDAMPRAVKPTAVTTTASPQASKSELPKMDPETERMLQRAFGEPDPDRVKSTKTRQVFDRQAALTARGAK